MKQNAAVAENQQNPGGMAAETQQVQNRYSRNLLRSRKSGRNRENQPMASRQSAEPGGKPESSNASRRRKYIETRRYICEGRQAQCLAAGAGMWRRQVAGRQAAAAVQASSRPGNLNGPDPGGNGRPGGRNGRWHPGGRRRVCSS